MRGHLHPQQAPRHNLLLQATPAMTSLQMNMTVLNKRNGGNAAKAGSAFLALTCLMGIVQRPVGGVDRHQRLVPHFALVAGSHLMIQ